MKMTTFKCPICGMEFISEYYEGGYIDHMNFAENFDTICVWYDNGDKNAFDNLIKHGIDLRDEFDIKNLLKCAKIYFRKKERLDIISHLDNLANNQIKRLKYLKRKKEQIEKIMKDFNIEEQRYLGFHY